MQDRDRHALADLLRTRRQQIIAAYEPKVRTLSPARDLPRAAVVNHVSSVLEGMASVIDAPEGRKASLGPVGREHAIDRLAQGFELEHLIREYRFLQEAVLEEWASFHGDTVDVHELRLLDDAFTDCLTAAASEYAALRGRVLRAVDRLSEAAFGPGDLDAFLTELISTTIESMPDVDTAAIFLVEGDELRMRAASGLDKVNTGFVLKIGEGFAGRIAATREPLSLRNAFQDPIIRNSVVRDTGIHAFYGVPLIRNGGLLGVAHIGSLTANEFSEDDKLLFRAMASRAASVIAKAHLIAEMQRSATENARLYAEAQAAVQTREQVLAIVSHDLRNQLGVLRMTARLLEALSGRGDLEAMKRPIETIDRAAVAMRRLVEDLLDMASLQAGRMSIIPREVDLKQIIEEACEPQMPVAKDRGIDLECPVIESVEVYADPERVLQVLGNLLGNAVKFCREGDSVRLLADTKPDEVLISVADTGPGIPASDLGHLFNPYRSAHRDRGGTGLGLYIAKGIVERHGGRIWVDTDQAKGTTFSFTLPRVPPGQMH